MITLVRFTITFLGLLIALFLLSIMEPVRAVVILPFTAMIASWCSAIVGVFDPTVVSSGAILGDGINHLRIEIVAGCSGVEAMIILLAGVFSFPAPLSYRIKGFLWGSLAIQALNTVRIISLFYLLQWDQDWFEWFHLYVWQALIILDALVVWLIWLRYLPKQAEPINTKQPQQA